MVTQDHRQCHPFLHRLDLISNWKKGHTYFQRIIAEMTLKVIKAIGDGTIQ